MWVYTHDRRNRQTALSVPTSSGTSMNRSWTWNEHDQLTGYTALTGVSETMQYEVLGRVISRNGTDKQYGFDRFGTSHWSAREGSRIDANPSALIVGIAVSSVPALRYWIT